jgi:hypothetical protein
MKDIARFFWEQSGTDKPFKDTPIETWKGMNRNNPTFEDLCDGIILVAKTLGSLGEFGTTIKYKSEKELLNAVVAQYEKKMMTTYNSSKFDKAKSPAAIAAMEKVRSYCTEYITLAKKLLS